MVIAYSRLFRVAISNALVSFHHGSDGGFTFSGQACEFCACNCDLLGESLKFSLAFIVRSRRAFAFARQTICLLREFLKAVFKLPSQLMQALRGGGMAQQLGACRFDFILSIRNQRQLLSMRLFSGPQRRSHLFVLGS